MNHQKLKGFLALSFGLMLSGSAFTAQIYGSYSEGCVRGAVQLPESSLYQIQHWGPERNFGHPELLSFIKDLAQDARATGLPGLLIGDLSKRYGGPFGGGSAHGTHNTGLDVDISFDFSKPLKSEYELSHPKDVLLTDARGLTVNSNFDSRREKLIMLAASDKRVQRIFVAPGIKRHLCELYSQDPSYEEALRRLRPWFGHRGHMHVRLRCPADSPECVSQAEVPSGNGCGAELLSWYEPPKPVSSQGKKTKPKKKVLPQQCKAVLRGW